MTEFPFTATLITDEILKEYTDSPLSFENALSNGSTLIERDSTGNPTSVICTRKLSWDEKKSFTVEFWRYDSKGRWLYKEPISVLKGMEVVPEGFSINDVLKCIGISNQ